jgi:hypothetical protein
VLEFAATEVPVGPVTREVNLVTPPKVGDDDAEIVMETTGTRLCTATVTVFDTEAR